MERNVVFQAIMYFVTQSPDSELPPYKTVADNLNRNFRVKDNGSAEYPITVKFNSGLQIGNFIKFLHLHSAIIWDPQHESEKLYIRINDSQYYPLVI